MLVAAASEARRTLFQSVLQRCYDEGDTRERRSILRALPLLPSAECFVALALEACRSHLQPLFEAIACDNPYPSRYFSDSPMNHMVLKALSLGIALDRIIGLEQRMTPELRRMAAGYSASGRPPAAAYPRMCGYCFAIDMMVRVMPPSVRRHFHTAALGPDKER